MMQSNDVVSGIVRLELTTQIYIGASQACSGYAASFGYELKDFAEAVLNGE